jgi:hypothetical protein
MPTRPVALLALRTDAEVRSIKEVKVTRWLLPFLIAVSPSAAAVVIRDDVADTKYRVEASEFPALVDMPGEGHGVLVAPEWVLTAAHTVSWRSGLDQVTVGGEARKVERVIVHPGFRPPPQALIEQALATGDGVLAVLQIAASDDIALVKLVEPVTDIAPVILHSAGDEYGRTVKIIGKGATGTGATGHDPAGPNRTALRRAYNTVTSAHERWFCYVFDAPSSALPLEGKTGSGDSGGPVLVEVDGQWALAGLAAWGFIQGDVRSMRPGLYGQLTCNVRIGHYADWIESVMAGGTSSGS